VVGLVCLTAVSLAGGLPQAAAADLRLPAATTPTASTLTKGPIGWDTYRRLDQLPSLPVGVQTQQFASTDPAGDNIDLNHPLGQTAGGSVILAEHSGPGEIDDVWSTMNNGNVTHTGNITVVLDGRTVLDAPEQDVVDGTLGTPFTFPLVANATQSSGGNYIDVPMPFTSSMLVTTTNDPSYYHVDYRTFADASGVATFNPADPASDVVTTLTGAGTKDPKGAQPGQVTAAATVAASPGRTDTVGSFAGPARINAIQIRVPQLSAAGAAAANDILQHVRLRITFDGQGTVDAPLGQFFGSGLGATSVQALMIAVDTTTDTLSAWWPMPYAQQATVSLYNGSSQNLSGGAAHITTAPAPGEALALGPQGQDGYFHATANAQNTVAGQNYPFLTANAWGKFVGVSETMQSLGPPPNFYLEGNEQAFVDDSPTPQINGTGTEDFYQGGWYFNKGAFSDPLNGAPAIVSTGSCSNGCSSAYRMMLADAVPFASSLRFGIQHGPVNTTPAAYSSTAYWYGRSGASPDLYQPLALTNGWSQAPGTDAATYVIEGAFVRLRGGIRGGATGQVIATLPPTLAPPADEWFSVVTANNVVAPLVVHPNGTIVLNAGSPGFVSLSGILVDVARSTSYQPLALQPGWSPQRSVDPPGTSPGYVQNGSYVELTGGIGGGGVGQVITTLPPNLAPAADEWFSVVTANNVVAPLVVHPNGNVVLNAGNPGFVSLAGVGVVVGPSGGSNLGLGAGWYPAFGTNAYAFAQYGKEVDLRGAVAGGSVGQTIFTLPPAARPLGDDWSAVVTANGQVAPLVAHSNGQVVLAGGSAGFVSLEDLRVSSG
jgi:hypothetical protein